MTSLRYYQQDLLEVLRATSPASGVIVSPAGSGIRRAIEIYLREAASTSLVLIVSSREILTDQWAERIRSEDAVPVTVLDSVGDALDILEGNRPRTGVLVATYARTQHGSSSRVLSELNFGVIVYDTPLKTLSSNVEQLNSRAQRVLALVDQSALDSSVLKLPVLWSITNKQLIDDNFFRTVDVPVDSTPEERALRDAVVAVLRRFDSARPLLSDSLAALHAQLLTLASKQTSEHKSAAQVWALVDRIESSGTADSRLAALDKVMDRAMREHTRCVVLVPTQTDAIYVYDHLDRTGRSPRAVLTGATASADRQSHWAGLNRGECLVSTHAAASAAQEFLPESAMVVLWPSVENQKMLNDLRWANDARDTTVFELTETPAR